MSSMEKIVSENLFLLEILVDRLFIKPEFLPAEVTDLQGETCVCFKFLDNPALEICEADFQPKRDYSSPVSNTKNGKSCLFALTAEQATDLSTHFNMDVTVLRKLETSCLPDKVIIGETSIPIVNIFNEVLQLLTCCTEPGCIGRTLKDTFKIEKDGEFIGEIEVFIRLSCFGKLIVTQFQMNLDDKSVFFKDNTGKSLYKYKKASKDDDAATRTSAVKNTSGCTPMMRDAYTEGRCQECSSPASYQAQAQYPAAPAVACKGDESCFQEIGAMMNGNGLTIRVHKDKGSIRKVGGSECEAEPAAVRALPRAQDNFPCSCLSRPNERQVYSIKGVDDPANPFAMNMYGCSNVANKNITVMPPCSTRADGMQMTEISDPNRDVFVLKIGKKSEGVDKKSNLELELITPKGADKKPVPKKETRETQYLESDADPCGTGGAAKAAKGAKGAKGAKAKTRPNTRDTERASALLSRMNLEKSPKSTGAGDGKSGPGKGGGRVPPKSADPGGRRGAAGATNLNMPVWPKQKPDGDGDDDDVCKKHHRVSYSRGYCATPVSPVRDKKRHSCVSDECRKNSYGQRKSTGSKGSRGYDRSCGYY